MIVVEVLGRRGEVAQQLRLPALPATIGRAWSNDLVLADPTVDPQHARIVTDEQGVIAIEDLGTVNGMWTPASKIRESRVVVNGVTQVRIGRTTLRIVRADHPVAAAIPDRAPTGRLAALLRSRGAMVALAGASILLLGFLGWLGSWDADPETKMTSNVVILALVIASWALMWAVINRLTAHQFNFLEHQTIAWIAVVGWTIVNLFSAWTEFLWPSGRLIALLISLAGLALSVWVLAAHLEVAGVARRGKRLGIAAGIVIGFGLVAILGEEAAKSEFSSGTVTLASSIRPLPPGMIPAGTVDGFLEAIDGVKRKVDKKID